MNPAVNNPLRKGKGGVWKAGLGLILLVAVLCRLLPLFLESFPDPDDYYHLRLATMFYNQGWVTWDPLSYGGRPYTYYPLYHLSIAQTAHLLATTPEISYAILGVFSGVLAVLAVFALALKAFDSPWLKRELGPYAWWTPYFAALLVAVTPGSVVRSSAFARPDSFAIAGAALGVLLLLEWEERGGWLRLAGVACLILVLSLLELPTALVVGFLLGVAALSQIVCGGGLPPLRKVIPFFLAAAAGLAASWILYYHALPFSTYLSTAPLNSSELVPFAFPTILYFGSIALLLSLLGLWWLYSRKGFVEFPWLAGWTLACLVFVLAGSRNFVFLVPPMALVAALGLGVCLKFAGKYSGAILVYSLCVCGVLLAAYLFSQWGQYTPADLAVASFLSTPQAGPAGLLASAWDRGHMLAFVTGRPVYVDGYFEFSPQAQFRIDLVTACLSGIPAALSVCAQQGIAVLYADGDLESDPSFGLSAYAGTVAAPIARVADSGAVAYRLAPAQSTR
jgi:asparagine N-glycosylation enzyme membrane subunit Stt3